MTRANSEQINANIFTMPEESFQIKESERSNFKQFCIDNCSFSNMCCVIGIRILQEDEFVLKMNHEYLASD